MDQLGVAICGSAFMLGFLYLLANRPVIFFSFFFILFTMAWRTCSMTFIDIAGPIYSSQTYRYVGPGTVTCLQTLAYFLTVIPFFLLLRPSLVRAWDRGSDDRAAAPGMLTLSDMTFLVSSLFLAWLFVDLVRHGPIPLFAHMERFVYTSENSGSAHRWLISYGNFVAFWWGMMLAAERLRNRRFDFRYPALLAVLLVYLFLTGNRFSAFYSFGSFFLIPLSAVVAVAAGGDQEKPFAYARQFLGRRELIAFGVISALLVVVITIGIYNNLANVRDFESTEIGAQFFERTLVQPGEIGWLSFQRVFEFGQWQPYRVFDFLFQFPINPNKNTTPQYLMLTTIGEPRTFEHISGGFQFAGGFPEIFFELFGPVFAWGFVAAAGFITAGLTALIVKGTIQGRYVSAFMAVYVLYGFYVMYIGGMLNFVAVSTYWMKAAALVLALLLEARLARSGLPLLPWALFPIGKIRSRIGMSTG
jgi:hypothetical protein